MRLEYQQNLRFREHVQVGVSALTFADFRNLNCKVWWYLAGFVRCYMAGNLVLIVSIIRTTLLEAGSDNTKSTGILPSHNRF